MVEIPNSQTQPKSLSDGGEDRQASGTRFSMGLGGASRRGPENVFLGVFFGARRSGHPPRHSRAHLMSTTRAALSVSVPRTSCFPSGVNVTL